MSEDGVIFLKFSNPDATKPSDGPWLIGCKHCNNKTWLLTQDDVEKHPKLKCAACTNYAGTIGWLP